MSKIHNELWIEGCLRGKYCVWLFDMTDEQDNRSREVLAREERTGAFYYRSCSIQDAAAVTRASRGQQEYSDDGWKHVNNDLPWRPQNSGHLTLIKCSASQPCERMLQDVL